MKRVLTVGVGLIAALALIAGNAFAAMFDPATGQGQVSKGELQSAFGWNNPQFQQNIGGVTFQYVETYTERMVCEQQQTGATRRATRTYSLDGLVVKSITGQQQITAIALTGYAGDPAESFGQWQGDTIPGACTNQGQGWDGETSIVEGSESAELIAKSGNLTRTLSIS